jgi:hypothetical protein
MEARWLYRIRKLPSFSTPGPLRKPAAVAVLASHPKSAIKRAVLNRFADVLRRDVFGRIEIGDGSRNFQDSIGGPGAQIQFKPIRSGIVAAR